MPNDAPSRNIFGLSDAVLTSVINAVIGAIVTIVLAYFSIRTENAVERNKASVDSAAEKIEASSDKASDHAAEMKQSLQAIKVAADKTATEVTKIPEAAAVAAKVLVEKTANNPENQ